MENSNLVSRLKRGEPKAYEVLYTEYVEKIGRIAKTYLGVDDVEDVIQEVFIRVYKNIRKFRGDSALSTWVYRITVNVCKDMLSKKRRRREILTSFGVEEDESKTLPEPVEYNRPSDEFLKETSAEEIHKAIDSLAKEDRLLITLREIENMSYADISDIVDKPIGTVKSRLHYARERLKEILEKNLEVLGRDHNEV